MSIVLEELNKRYDGHPVVNNVSLEIADGEFFVLLGSSGSGKTTVLNMIAGLTGIDKGRILLHGRDVTYLPPQERRVGFVFQNYALFQHMTVAENIEFGLRVRKTPSAERRRRRDELLELVGLAGLGSRMPRQISGGQQQRVALARALAFRPDVLLLDEPLGALDAKIRVELRRTLHSIQREAGVTTILVTHDQEEAFELADRLGVMSFGRLLEVGPPEQLYRQPQTEFVATFLGTANLLATSAASNAVDGGSHFLSVNGGTALPQSTHRVQLLFRPEDVMLAASPQELDCPMLGKGEVEQTVFGGPLERLRLRLPPIPDVRPISPPVEYGEDDFRIEATRTQDQVSRFPLLPGQNVWVGVSRVHTLEQAGLRFLILSDGSSAAQDAIAVAGQMARLAHARVTLLVHGLTGDALQEHMQKAKEQLGSGLPALDTFTTSDAPGVAAAREVERQSYDLLILASGSQQVATLAEQVLVAGEHHLLLVPRVQPVPTRALICVASGEPGKVDVLFTGRLARHLGAEATLLTVLPRGAIPGAEERANRFLANGVRTLEVLGVPAQTVVRTGPIHEEIQREIKAHAYDLLAVGMPLPNQDGKVLLQGVVRQLVEGVTDRAVLLVRSVQTRTEVPLLTPMTRIGSLKEMI
jgi:sulfate transport system ATP-binding protein